MWCCEHRSNLVMLSVIPSSGSHCPSASRGRLTSQMHYSNTRYIIKLGVIITINLFEWNRLQHCPSWRQLFPMCHLMTDMPVLEVFIERFIDPFTPDGHGDCGSSSAIRRAGSVMMFSPLLTQAFRAVSIAYFGQSTSSPRVMSQGYKIYCQTLNHLQLSL